MLRLAQTWFASSVFLVSATRIVPCPFLPRRYAQEIARYPVGDHFRMSNYKDMRERALSLRSAWMTAASHLRMNKAKWDQFAQFLGFSVLCWWLLR